LFKPQVLIQLVWSRSWELRANVADFCSHPITYPTKLIHIGQRWARWFFQNHQLSSSGYIWTYQDMMEWMSRILVGEMAGADEDFGSGVKWMWLIFVQALTDYQTQKIRMDQSWSFQNHQLSSSGHIRTWWNGWAGYWLEKWLVLMMILAPELCKCGWFLFQPQLYVYPT
jgi:hypothetical protein